MSAFVSLNDLSVYRENVISFEFNDINGEKSIYGVS